MDQKITVDELRTAARAGSKDLGDVLERYRPRLERMIALRLDRRLAGRIDAGDVLQEAFVEVMKRLEEYVARPELDFFLWVRFLTGQKLLQVHRRHLATVQRDARLEVPLFTGTPGASSVVVASAILDGSGTPSRAAMRAEHEVVLRDALEEMDVVDREVLILRHFEQLTNTEIAQVLGITPSAASQRYFKALARMRTVLDRLGLDSGATA